MLFTDERFKPISAEAKILYGILLDRMSLSRKNGWLDDANRVFIIYTLEEVMDAIRSALIMESPPARTALVTLRHGRRISRCRS